MTAIHKEHIIYMLDTLFVSDSLSLVICPIPLMPGFLLRYDQNEHGTFLVLANFFCQISSIVDR